MGNNSYYEMILNEKFKDIYTISTILILIGAVVGSLGNSAIIYIYWFRIKESGERYFLPLVAFVDLTACLTSTSFYVMDNTYFFSYPNDTICRILSFLQICISGISAHSLLVISVQRYRLVCKPHNPRLSLKCKRIAFFAACIITLVYSCPILGTSGIEDTEQLFMNHTVRTRICRFSIINSSMINIYFGILALITICNLVATMSLFIPILKRISIVLSGFKVKMTQKANEHHETSFVTSTTDIDTEDINVEEKKTHNNSIFNHTNDNITRETRGSNKVEIETTDVKADIEDITNQAEKCKHTKQKSRHGIAKRRITIMFFVIILVYVLSYIPSIVILILTYTITDFSYIKLSRSEAAAWTYLSRFVFLNHLANPFICGYFDVKFKNELAMLFYKILKKCKL